MKKLLVFVLTIAILSALGISINARENESVEALYFNIIPTIDGIVTEDEWGTPTIQVRKANASKPEAPVEGNAWYFSPGTGDVEMNYDMWLRWDEDNIYLAVVVTDPDGHSIIAGEGSLWNGDVIQFRIDGAGPNGSGNPASPWSESTIPNMAVGKLNDGTVTAWNFQEGSVEGILKYMVIVDGTKTTYEVIIPHSFVSGEGKAGFTYGMSLVVLNAPEGETYNSWLTWGDGICGPQADDIRVGSNAVSLSATEAIVIIEEVVEAAEVVAEITPVTVTTSAPVTKAAQTSDVGYIMFILLASISILSGLLIVKKAKR